MMGTLYVKSENNIDTNTVIWAFFIPITLIEKYVFNAHLPFSVCFFSVYMSYMPILFVLSCAIQFLYMNNSICICAPIQIGHDVANTVNGEKKEAFLRNSICRRKKIISIFFQQKRTQNDFRLPWLTAKK